MGRRIWIVIPDTTRQDADGHKYHIPGHSYNCRVLSFQGFYPADPSVGRIKHLVQLWTDPGGMRTLSVGSISLKDPGKIAAGRAAAATRAGQQ